MTENMSILDEDNIFTYYLAGPMTGFPEYNFPAFEKAKADLESVGFKIASPHDIDHGETEETRGSLDYTVYLRAGFKLLLECQGIIMLPGWHTSKGAVAEFNLALSVGMRPMLYSPIDGSLREL